MITVIITVFMVGIKHKLLYLHTLLQLNNKYRTNDLYHCQTRIKNPGWASVTTISNMKLNLEKLEKKIELIVTLRYKLARGVATIMIFVDLANKLCNLFQNFVLYENRFFVT